jgi:GxxExxY protein
MNANAARINELSNLVIGCALTVANTLGSGFVEKVYENALAYEIRKWPCGGAAMRCHRQVR